MRCPRDTVISVQWAQYGRLATSSNNDLCPAVTWKPLSERRAAVAYLQQPSPRTDWLSSSAVSTTTVAMTTVASNYSALRRAAERITCLSTKSLEVWFFRRVAPHQYCTFNVKLGTSESIYRVVQKTDTFCFVRLNFIKYWPIVKLFQCKNQESICNNNVTKDPTTPQMCRYTIYLVKCQCLKSNNWKEDEFCNNTFK